MCKRVICRRVKFLVTLIISKIVVSRVMCQSNAHQHMFAQSIFNDGGEGLILRRFHSLYESGRTPSLIKLKVRTTLSTSTFLPLYLLPSTLYLYLSTSSLLSISLYLILSLFPKPKPPYYPLGATTRWCKTV